jgi:hypothetical protein
VREDDPRVAKQLSEAQGWTKRPNMYDETSIYAVRLPRRLVEYAKRVRGINVADSGAIFVGVIRSPDGIGRLLIVRGDFQAIIVTPADWKNDAIRMIRPISC